MTTLWKSTNNIPCQSVHHYSTFFWGLIVLQACTTFAEPNANAIDIGSRRELLVDDHLIQSLRGEASHRLHHPVRREVAIVHDAPWEGSGGGYHTVFFDPDYKEGGRYRMYYHAWQIATSGEKTHPLYIAYAESEDGIHWVKPELGIYEHDGSKANNIVLGDINGEECHDLSVFKDNNPQCKKSERYKGVGLGRKPGGLYAFKSPDGIHWSLYNDSKPVMTGHPFDTQNVAFWDPNIGKYRAYIRDFDNGRRDIMMATSDDFIHWTDRQWLQYANAPQEQLYTNQVKPYYRAPHLLIGFPSRYVDRGWTNATRALPSLDLRKHRSQVTRRYGTAVTDALLMTSRNGLNFHRWNEAFIRPGLRIKHNWAYGDNYIARHVVETDSVEDDSPRELSLYATESYFTGKMSRLRRYTMRIDGFASIFAPLDGGELITKPLVFDGDTLNINFSTSAGGSIRVEIQDTNEKAIEGFTLDDCEEIFGDAVEYPVRWRAGSDVRSLAGKPVRLRFTLRDADLYALRFTPSLPKASAALTRAEPIKVVCFGDSVTGVYYHTGSRRAYTSMVKLALQQTQLNANVIAVNAGISGNTTANALDRIERDVLSHEPDVVTVMFGLNDMVRVPLEQFRANLVKIIEQCRGVGAEVLLCTPNSVIKDTPGRTRAKLIQYCDAIRAVGREQAVTVCDIYEAFESFRARDPLGWRMLMSDEFHPNMDGHRLIATEIARAMTGQDVSLRKVKPLTPAIPKVLARLHAKEPVKVLAMPPYDKLIEPALKQVDPAAQVDVTPWPTADQRLAEIEEFAKGVRKMDVDLVMVAVPATADAPSVDQFIRSYSWIMNWSLSFSHQQWDVVAITAQVADPDAAEANAAYRGLATKLIRAQDLTMIDRRAGDEAPASDILVEWLKAQALELDRTADRD